MLGVWMSNYVKQGAHIDYKTRIFFVGMIPITAKDGTSSSAELIVKSIVGPGHHWCTMVH
jgi:hypothetical protein